MMYINPILFVILISSCFSASINAQSESVNIYAVKSFEKSFPSNITDWDSYENLYMDSYSYGTLKSGKLGLTTDEIFGKAMIYEFGNFNIHLVITSDSTLYLRNNKTGQNVNEKMSSIHIDENKLFTSFVDADNNFVTMLSDFENGKTSAFFYKDDASVTSFSGSIIMKK